MIRTTNIGHLQKKNDRFEGEIYIEDIDLSPIEGKFFIYEKDGMQYLWIKRKPIMEYNDIKREYEKRQREPRWEAYLHKQNNDLISYVGEFVFLHFKFKIQAIWDNSEEGRKKQKLMLYVERLPKDQQTIINNINERNNKNVWR